MLTAGGYTGFGTAQAQGIYLAWNRIAGSGRGLFANIQGSGTGGFEWINYTKDGAVTYPSPLMTLDRNGLLSVQSIAASLTGNVTGSSTSFTGSLVGEVTGTQGATLLSNDAVIAKKLTSYLKGAGVISATDSVLGAIQKLDANTDLVQYNLDVYKFDNSSLIKTIAVEAKTGTLNLGCANTTSVLNIGCGTGSQIVNIGIGAGVTTINAGGLEDNVVIQGGLTCPYINTKTAVSIIIGANNLQNMVLQPSENTDFNGNITIKNGANLKLQNVNNNQSITIKSPALASSSIITLPATQATTGQVLTCSDTTGTLAWKSSSSTTLASTMVERDASGNATFNNITGNLIGNASGSSASFTGALLGQVTGTQGATILSNDAVIAKKLTSYVKGAGTISANDSILSAIQKLDANITTGGSISTITLGGDVTGDSSASVVAFVGGVSATDIANASISVGYATSQNDADSLVKRDHNGSVELYSLYGASMLNAGGFEGLAGRMQGLYLGWNRVSGSGRAFFGCQQGDGTGGFEWLNYSSAGIETSASPLMTLSGDGWLTAMTGITTTNLGAGNVATTNLSPKNILSDAYSIRNELVVLPISIGANNTTQFARLTLTNGGALVKIDMVIDQLNYTQSKSFIVAISFNSTIGTWQKLIPRGEHLGNSQDTDIDIRVASGEVTFRLRRTSGTIAGTAMMKMEVVHGGLTYSSLRTIETDLSAIECYFDGENCEQTLTGSWTGGLTSNNYMIVKVNRKGKQIMLSLQPFTASASSHAYSTFSVALPFWAYPSSNYGTNGLYHPIIVSNAGIQESGLAIIDPTTKKVSISRMDTSTGWTIGPSAGMLGGQNICYLID